MNENKSVANQFYKLFLFNILHEVLFVLTDKVHKSGFYLQAKCLRQIILGANNVLNFLIFR